MSKLPRITGKEVAKVLQKAGFVEIRVRGSHHYFYNRDKDKLVTVPCHAGKILAPKTLKSILDQAGVTLEGQSLKLLATPPAGY